MNIPILLVEDDLFLREGLEELLIREGYRVTAAGSVKQARVLLSEAEFSLIILDVLLPDGNGLALCRQLRAGGKNTPILLLTACDEESEIVAGLDSGADDYVTKPFGINVLLSRIRALLRRSSPGIYEANGLVIDFGKMTVRRNGEPVYLTPTEFQILSALIRNAGAVVTRAGLLSAIWDCDESFIDDNTLSVHISRLREKIGSDRLCTVRGVGYRWEEKG